MDLTEIIQEVCENHPDKIVVDISEYENDEHQFATGKDRDDDDEEESNGGRQQVRCENQ